MKIAMVDPSLFVIPYDRALCAALEGKGATVRLFGRPLRDGEEIQLHGRAVDAVFYRLAESPLARRTPKRARLIVKGLEHALSLRRLARELRRWKPDVIHFQWLPLPMIDRLFIGGLRRIAPVVATVHDTTPFNANPSSRLQGLHAFTVLAACDRVIVHTAKAIPVLSRQGVPQQGIVCIPHGMLELPDAAPGPPTAAGGRVRMLQFGNIKPYKGVDTLLRAVASLAPETRARCEIVVAGRAVMDVSGLLALRTELGIEDCVRFEFRFFSEAEMGRLFSDAEILLFPYREIEASGVLYSALAFGKPVIATRVGIFEELLVDGVHGLLTSPDDQAGLARAIEELHADAAVRARMGEQVRELSRRIAGWDDIAESTMKLYRSAREVRR